MAPVGQLLRLRGVGIALVAALVVSQAPPPVTAQCGTLTQAGKSYDIRPLTLSGGQYEITGTFGASSFFYINVCGSGGRGRGRGRGRGVPVS